MARRTARAATIRADQERADRIIALLRPTHVYIVPPLVATAEQLQAQRVALMPGRGTVTRHNMVVYVGPQGEVYMVDPEAGCSQSSGR